MNRPFPNNCAAVSPSFNAVRLSPTAAVAQPGPHEATVQVWYNRGKMLVEQQRYNAAINSFDMALKLQPHETKSLIFRGIALFHLHYYQSALRDFRTATEIAPDNREAWIFQGVVLKALERHSAAMACYQTALLLQHRPEAGDFEKYPLWI
jgi:tetratricopeptide (TPR) repeat protein